MRFFYLLLLPLLALPAAAQSPAFAVDTSTVALYTFDGADPDTTFDISDNGLHASNDGTVSMPGRHGNARQFDGVDDRIGMDAVRVALQGTSAWTLDYIASVGSSGTLPALLLHNCGNGWRLQATRTVVRYAVKTATSGCSWDPNRSLNIPNLEDAWHYFALTFGDGALRLYIDGELVDAPSASGEFDGLDDRRAWIGYSESGAGSYFSGFADELRVSDVARSASEICTTANDLGWPCAVTANENDAELQAGTLYPAMPNPFEDRATLRYAVAEPGRVTLTVFDVLGREVTVLVDDERAAGRHEAVLDGTGLPSGVYVVRMTADGFAETRRVTLLR